MLSTSRGDRPHPWTVSLHEPSWPWSLLTRVADLVPLYPYILTLISSIAGLAARFAGRRLMAVNDGA